MPLNRLVAFVIGPVATLAAGYVSLWLTRHFPGAHLPSQKSIAGVITSGAVTIVPMVLTHLKVQKWLTGWQLWEKRTDEMTNGALDASVKTFLENVAAKTGVELPSGVTPVDLAGEYVAVEPVDADQPLGEGSPTAGQPPPAAAPGAFEGPNTPGQ